MPYITDITELDLTGMDITAYEWKGERLSCEYGAGYGDSAVVGPTSGLWGWEISSDCLPDASSYKNLINGLPRMQYYQEFIRDHITGDEEIFVIDFRGHKFHASFVENSISGAMHSYDVFGMEGVKIKQRRVAGYSYRVSDGSIFDPTCINDSIWGWFNPNLDGATIDLSGDGNDLSVNGDATGLGTTANGLGTNRMNGTTNDGYLNTTADPVIYNAFFVMQMRETTFSNYAGILTADSGTAFVTGDSGTTKFYNQLLSIVYTKNGVSFAESNQQAPMNQFAVCHWKRTAGVGLTNLQIGKDRGFAGRFAEMDWGEIILCDVLLSDDDATDLENFLMRHWGIA